MSARSSYVDSAQLASLRKVRVCSLPEVNGRCDEWFTDVC